MSRPLYASVDDLLLASDFNPTATRAAVLQRHLASASDAVDLMMRRRFYPLTTARTFQPARYDTPLEMTSAGFHLDDDLYSLTSVTADGATVSVSDVDLWPLDGPPYSWIGGATGSVIVITGVWGFPYSSDDVTTITSSPNSSTTSMPVASGADVGVGDLIQVGTERMIVTAKTTSDTTIDTTGALTASAADVTVGVDDGTAFAVGETIWVDSERMRIIAISGNDLTVERAWLGAVLAVHSSGADVYAERALTVERGATGSTAASHTSADTVTKLTAPDPISDLTIAEAQIRFEQETSRYGRTIGTGDGETEARGAGIEDLRAMCRRMYQRKRAGAAV